MKAKATYYAKVFLVMFTSLIWIDGLAGFSLFLCMTNLTIRRIVDMTPWRLSPQVRHQAFKLVTFANPIRGSVF